MPATQIPNPNTAFAPYYTQQVPQGVVYTQSPAAGSGILVTHPVALNTAGSAISAPAAASAPWVIGIAIDSGPTASTLVRVVTSGLVAVSALTAISAGAIVSPSAGGVTAASATIGSNIGVAVTTTASAGPITIFVAKM